MLMLAKPSDHDWDMMEGILEDIDFDLNVKLLLDSWVGSTSMRNKGDYATLNCMS
jgi:hypothetical protein